MGVDADRSLRPSVGWSTTDEDVDAFVTAIERDGWKGPEGAPPGADHAAAGDWLTGGEGLAAANGKAVGSLDNPTVPLPAIESP